MTNIQQGNATKATIVHYKRKTKISASSEREISLPSTGNFKNIDRKRVSRKRKIKFLDFRIFFFCPITPLTQGRVIIDYNSTQVLQNMSITS